MISRRCRRRHRSRHDRLQQSPADEDVMLLPLEQLSFRQRVEHGLDRLSNRPVSVTSESTVIVSPGLIVISVASSRFHPT